MKKTYIDESEHLNTYLKSNMSNKRYNHSRSVAEMSEILALRLNLDKGKAYYAGLAHDIAREFPKELQIQYKAQLTGLSDSFIQKDILLHGPIGALYLREKFNISDEDILEAVKYHSVGHSGLSHYAKVVYVADYISMDRKHINDSYRSHILNLQIDDMVLAVAESCITFLTNKGDSIVEETIKMINELRGTN